MSKPSMNICPRCEGTGQEQFYNVNYDISDIRECTMCDGTGRRKR